MSLREQEYRDVCHDCDDWATTTCRRCGRPLCGAHTPASSFKRCRTCERWYEEQLAAEQRPKKHRWHIVALLVGGIVLFISQRFMSGNPQIFLGVPALAMLCAGIIGFCVIRPARARWKERVKALRTAFLDERSER